MVINTSFTIDEKKFAHDIEVFNIEHRDVILGLS